MNTVASTPRIESDEEQQPKPEKRVGRRKITIEYITDKSRRHITFSKRKAGIMKKVIRSLYKAYELSTLTGTQVLLLVASETGHVYTFATPKLQPLITKPEGKNLIQTCLNTPDQFDSIDRESTYVDPPAHEYEEMRPGFTTLANLSQQIHSNNPSYLSSLQYQANPENYLQSSTFWQKEQEQKENAEFLNQIYQNQASFNDEQIPKDFHHLMHPLDHCNQQDDDIIRRDSSSLDRKLSIRKRSREE